MHDVQIKKPAVQPAGFFILKRCEPAVKPGSVLCCQSDNHSSRTYVAARLKQPTRPQRGPRQRGPIWSCSGWSLPCHELLPAARCALTAPFHPYLIPLTWAIGGLLSVALVVGSRPPGVTWHPALWSPDFPPPACAGSDCLGQLTARIIRQNTVLTRKSLSHHYTLRLPATLCSSSLHRFKNSRHNR
jgi:hypothetical protein